MRAAYVNPESDRVHSVIACCSGIGAGLVDIGTLTRHVSHAARHLRRAGHRLFARITALHVGSVTTHALGIAGFVSADAVRRALERID